MLLLKSFVGADPGGPSFCLNVFFQRDNGGSRAYFEKCIAVEAIGLH